MRVLKYLIRILDACTFAMLIYLYIPCTLYSIYKCVHATYVTLAGSREVTAYSLKQQKMSSVYCVKEQLRNNIRNLMSKV